MANSGDQEGSILSAFFPFFLYILPGARFQVLLAGVNCTLQVAG